MKKYVFTIMMIIVNMTLLCQVKEAYITFDQLSYDFGQIKESDSIVKCKFRFTNTGRSPLIIHDVKTTCGCTTPIFSKAPVLPDEKKSIEVGFNPKGRPGPFLKKITVFSNAVNKNVVLEIKGEVKFLVSSDFKKSLTVEEKYKYHIGNAMISNNHVAFANIFIDDIKIKSIEIYNPSDTLMILSCKDFPKHLSVKLIPEHLIPGETGTIVFTYNAKLKNDWGFVFDRVVLSINGQPQIKDALSVTANIVENFGNLTPEEKANSPVIHFDTLNHDFDTIYQFSKVSYKYFFENKGKTDLIIRKVKASCGCTASQAGLQTIKPGESSYIDAVFDAGGRKGIQNKTITVVTNDPVSSSVVLKFKAVVIPKKI